MIKILRYILRYLRVGPQSDPRHKIDQVLNNMRCKRDETQNTSDEKYISQVPENKTEIYANQKKDRAEMDSLACKVSP